MTKNLLIRLSALFLLPAVTACPGDSHIAAGHHQMIKTVKQNINAEPISAAVNHQTIKTVKQNINVKPINAAGKLLPMERKGSHQAAKAEGIQVVANPESIPVLVNKQNKLPDHYHPDDLVTLQIPFILGAAPDSRKMRKEAAAAMEKMYETAKREGIILLGVSAYRSHASQTTLFNSYVKNDGYAKAITYSALPGTSEHETGLAIDVTGANGRCAAEDCFGGTKEANWLQAHAGDFGFIIRYPKGKEAITGYQYEPWHLRYVGQAIARDIMDKHITLEEYYQNQ